MPGHRLTNVTLAILLSMSVSTGYMGCSCSPGKRAAPVQEHQYSLAGSRAGPKSDPIPTAMR